MQFFPTWRMVRDLRKQGLRVDGPYVDIGFLSKSSLFSYRIIHEGDRMIGTIIKSNPYAKPIFNSAEQLLDLVEPSDNDSRIDTIKRKYCKETDSSK